MAQFTPEQIEEFLEQFFDVVGRRQYVGARYVPLFGRKGETSIAWDNSAPYEPLTIVLYQGDSYTSRTYVPTGVDILNQDYWVLTGNYNAQIAAYREEVLTFDGRIDSLEDVMPISSFTSTDTVKKYVDDNIEDLGELLPASSFTSTDTVKKYVDDNIEDLGKLLPASSFTSTDTVKKYVDESVSSIMEKDGRNLLMIGNSYTDGIGSTSGTSGLYSYLSKYFNHKYKFTTGGGAFATYTAHQTSFVDLLSTAASTLTQEQREEITHIVFVSAVGDDRVWTAQADRNGTWLETALGNVKTIVDQSFPNAVPYVYLATGSASNGTGDVTNETSTALHNLFTVLSAKKGMCYLGWGGYSITHESNRYSNDNYHPNDNGYKILAANLINGLFGGGVKYPSYQQTLTFSNNGTNLMSARCVQTIDGIYIQPETIERTFSGSTPTEWTIPTNTGVIGKTFCRSGIQDNVISYNALSRTDTDHYKLNPTVINMMSNGDGIQLHWLLAPMVGTVNYYMVGNIYLSSKVA